MGQAFEFILNGRRVSVTGVSINTTLLDYLRGAGLTGSKESCAEGDCGACAALVIERDANGKATYRSINSCLVPVCLLAGREIVSIEGVGCPEDMHPVQQKMVELHGSQCGYCTPGFICSLFEGFYRDDLPAGDDLDEQCAGNLCRCTGYRPIRDAAVAAFAERPAGDNQDAFAERLKKTDAKIGAIRYEFNGEKFFRPTSLTELFRLMEHHPEAQLISGATELGVDINKRYRRFSTLISLEAVPELKEFLATESEWRIGAAVTLTEVQDRLAGELPVLGSMLRVFGSRQIRNRATMGGNIVTASPVGDSAPLLLALDAEVVLASADGERTLPFHQFFVSYRKPALQQSEVLRTIILPRGACKPGLRRESQWFKVSKRRQVDISTVAACFSVDLDRRNIVRHARLAYGGVAAMPARARKTEAVLLGKAWNEETIRRVLPILRSEFSPISDVRGSAEYRAGLVTGLLEKFFVESTSKSSARPKSAWIKKVPGGPGPGSSIIAHTAPPHESGHKHVTGKAVFIDDQIAGKRLLEVWPVCSPHAHAEILKRDGAAAQKMPGIRAVLLAEDIPGSNNVGIARKDEILLADKVVLYHGHIVALVVGETQEACRLAAEKVIVEYEPLPAIVTLRDAIARESIHAEANFIRRGDDDKALRGAPLVLEGEFELAGQEHFYLETQTAWAQVGEDGSVFVVSSTQNPAQVQQAIAHLLRLPENKVVVQSPRMGGAFGGKETQAAAPAALAALAAHHTGQPVRVRFNREHDMAVTGHRHPFLARFKVGFNDDGLLLAAKIHLWSNGGWAMDLSQAVMDRALFHLDNAYYLPAVEFRGQVAKTNLSSNTALRGFGGPQGMLVMEEIIDRIARRLGLPPELVRERNLYRGKGETNTTHYGQEIEDNRIQSIWHELKETAELEQRRVAIAKWNAAHAHTKRGIAMTPVKFGISFTATHLNQAGAFVLIYLDGSVQVNHGGTEMGQGIHTNIATIAARELGVKPEQVRVMPTSTDKLPNTSATAASAGTDLNGAATKNACEILRARLAPVALALVAGELAKLNSVQAHNLLAVDAAVEDLVFSDGFVFHKDSPEIKVSFADVVKKAHLERVSLSAAGYYSTPGIHWDHQAGRGKPFHYFAYGAAVTEVEVDGFTGMHRVPRVDILHDAGDSVNEGISRGQIEGGFVQGMGWLTMEELKWDDQGRLLTLSSDTYKVPAFGDMPQIFNVTLLKNATQKNVVHGSKAVGEPPLMLSISVREAIRDAVSAFGSGKGEVALAVPATGEAIWMAIQAQRGSKPASTPPVEPAAEPT